MLSRIIHRSFSVASTAVRRIDVHQSNRFAGATVHNGVVYLTGQVPAEGHMDSAVTQTKSVLAGIDDLLKKAGTDKSRLLKATCLLTHIDEDFAAMNAEWVKWLPAGAAPARTTIASVRLADPRWRIEIEIIAAMPEQSVVARKSWREEEDGLSMIDRAKHGF